MATKILNLAAFIIIILFSKELHAQNIIILDHDNDGIEDSIDKDDDNDGILDVIEENAAMPDVDNDGIPNIWDLDSDNDGISDALEAGFADVNGDGIIDEFIDLDRDGGHDLLSTVTYFIDNDLDNIPNYFDTDSNNDGIVDAVEMGGRDDNNDGRLDDFRDSDLDGFHDKVDGDVGNMLAPGDTSITSSSKFSFIPTKNQWTKLRTLTRLARTCEDIDMDGLCDDFDGDIGNTLKIGYDFVIEEL